MRCSVFVPALARSLAGHPFRLFQTALFQIGRQVIPVMRKRLWVLIAVAALLVVVLIVIGHNHRHSAAVEAAPGPPAAQAATVQRGNINQILTLAGQFQPYQEVDVHPKVTGFIRHIYVDIGDKVRQGQTLAVLEIPELQAQLAETNFSVQKARDEIVRAQHEVKRAESTNNALHLDNMRLEETNKAQPGLVAQQELDDAQAKDLSSAADVDAARAALAAAQKGLQVAQADNQRVSALEDYTNVVAPLNGVVLWRYADTGALIQSGMNSNSQDLPIVKLGQSDLMRLRLPIPEDYVRYIHVGDPMEVRVDALNRSFTGKVVRFTREVNFETRTMQTEIDVPNKDYAIDSGMYANVLLHLASADHVLTIPVEALVLHGNQQQVYAVDSGNRVQIRTVQVGIQGNKLVQIASGLEAGDRVILGGQQKYEQDEAVTPMLTRTPASETLHMSGGVIDMKGEQAANGSEQ